MAKKSKKVLVKWRPDWADEAYFPGFAVMTKAQWEDYKDTANSLEGIIVWGFGTNEYNEYHNPEEFLKEFQAVKITSEEESVLLKLFGDTRFGSDLPDVHYLAREEDEEDEEDAELFERSEDSFHDIPSKP